jgi:hypothetical protein
MTAPLRLAQSAEKAFPHRKFRYTNLHFNSESIRAMAECFSRRSSACHPRREIWAEADDAFRTVRRSTLTESQHREKRGAIEGPIRIPLNSQLFLINALVLPSISSKSFRFLSVLFSIFTALLQLSKNVGANPPTGWFRNSDARTGNKSRTNREQTIGEQ